MAMSINPRSIQDEGAFLPDSIDDLIDLRERVIAAGHGETVANGLVGWLVSKKAGDVGSPTKASTRARYRRILRELDGGSDIGQAQSRPDLSPPAAGDGRPGTAGQRRNGRGDRKGDLVPVASEDGPDDGETPRISERSITRRSVGSPAAGLPLAA